ncbi:MAG: roadblock/LC7 domain-containing protein [Promethearchaeota archaeon]
MHNGSYSIEEKITSILKSFRERTGTNYTILFNNDGLEIAVDQGVSVNKNKHFDQNIAAVNATIISLANSGINLLNNTHCVKNLTIQAGHQLDNDSFIILMENVKDDISLLTLFSVNLNISVILFELKQIAQKLLNFFQSNEEDKINVEIPSDV